MARCRRRLRIAAAALTVIAAISGAPARAADYPPSIPTQPPGSSTAYIDGLPVTTIMSLTNNTMQFQILSNGIMFQVSGTFTYTGTPQWSVGPLTEPTLTINEGGSALISGSGFLVDSPVNCFITPTALGSIVSGTFTYLSRAKASALLYQASTSTTLLGRAKVDRNGGFNGSFPLPPGLPPGKYTISATGITPEFQTVAVAIGARVVGSKGQRASTRVFFDPGSAALTEGAKADLDALAERVPTGAAAVQVQVTGYVQPTTFTGNDQRLSSARARTVADYLKTRGLDASYRVSGAGQATQTGPTGRRVQVVVTYFK